MTEKEADGGRKSRSNRALAGAQKIPYVNPLKGVKGKVELAQHIWGLRREGRSHNTRD